MFAKKAWLVLKQTFAKEGKQLILKTSGYAHLGLKPITTRVQSLQNNVMAESFVKTFKRDYVQLVNRPDSAAVLNGLKTWFEQYNQQLPHAALKYLSLRTFRARQSLIN